MSHCNQKISLRVNYIVKNCALHSFICTSWSPTCWKYIPPRGCQTHAYISVYQPRCEHLILDMLLQIFKHPSNTADALRCIFSLRQQGMKEWSKVGQTARRSDEAWLAAKKMRARQKIFLSRRETGVDRTTRCPRLTVLSNYHTWSILNMEIFFSWQLCSFSHFKSYLLI